MTKTNNTKADKANESNLDPLAFIDRVRVAQDEWNEKMFQGTNARLLSLLADCHAVYDALTAAGVSKRKAFTAKLEKEGFKYKEGVHLSTKIVHCERGDEARLPARWVDVLGRCGAGSFGPALWSTLAMTRRTAAIGV